MDFNRDKKNKKTKTKGNKRGFPEKQGSSSRIKKR